MIGVGSRPDTFSLPSVIGFNGLDGRAQVSPRLVNGERTGVFILAGQSNSPGASYVDAAYTATKAKNHNLNLYNGGMYASQDRLLGGGFGNTGGYGARLADKLIDDGVFDRVILVPCAVGGTFIAEWASGAAYFQRLVVATRRCAALGLPVTAYVFHQGENDKNDGTSQTSYAASLSAMIEGVRDLGDVFQAPWFIGLCSYTGGTTGSGIRAAQASVVDGISIFSGADTDTLTGTTTYRQGDDLHLTADGADAAATLWKNAIDAVF